MTEEEIELSEKLGQLELSDDLFPKYQTPDPKTTSSRDELLIDYLEVLDQYTLAQNKINEELKEGYIQLSRANYASHSIRKPYGRDYWDERVKPIRKVELGKELSIVDVEVEQKVEKETKNVKSIRNRKAKGDKEDKNEDENKPKPKKKYNPINMFGVLVPLQLRESQSHFIKSLNPIVEVINLRKKLEKLSSEIEELDKEEKPTSDDNKPTKDLN